MQKLASDPHEAVAPILGVDSRPVFRGRRVRHERPRSLSRADFDFMRQTGTLSRMLEMADGAVIDRWRMNGLID